MPCRVALRLPGLQNYNSGVGRVRRSRHPVKNSRTKPTRQMHRHVNAAALQCNRLAFPRRLSR